MRFSFLGYSPESSDLKTFSVMVTYSGYLDVNFTDTENNTIYSTVRCTNNAGLVTYAFSDGIKISQNAPNASNVQMSHVTLSQTEYPPSDGFQGVSDSLRLYWSGFDDPVGISSHKVIKKLLISKCEVLQKITTVYYSLMSIFRWRSISLIHMKTS